MRDDEVFRWVVIAMISVFGPIGVYHRSRSWTGERLSRWQEGWLILFGLRLAGLCCFLALLAFLIRPEWMRWSSAALPSWVRWMGLPLGMAAVAWGTWMFHTLGTNLTDTVAVREKAYLVTHGPYRWVRHPMYACVAAFGVSLGLLTANAFIVVMAAVVVIVLAIRSRTEEAKLVERFGEAYLEYARRTGRFLPRFRGHESKSLGSVRAA